MDFAYDQTTADMLEQIEAFMAEFVYPAEEAFREQVEAMANPWDTPPIIEELKARRARAVSGTSFCRDTDDGAGLTNLAVRAALRDDGAQPLRSRRRLSTARRPTPATWSCSRCSAPPSRRGGGSAAARGRDPLGVLDDRAGGRLAPTRPTSRRRIVRDGDEYVINGRKWWTSGAMSPRCKLLIVMGVTDPDAERHRRRA